MQRNIGRAERLIRVVIGMGVLSLALFGPQNPWCWLGLIPVLTGRFGWCPVYYLLRVSTYEDPR